MKTSEKHLIDYWIETGQVRTERRVPGDPASKNVYFFKHELVGDLELSMSWAEFFRVFNAMNHTVFLKELSESGRDGVGHLVSTFREGEIVENPFDPWRNPSFVGISIRIPPHNRQDYRLIEIITHEG